MTLGFKRMFGQPVWEGSKTHSVRAGKRWRVGMICNCFLDMRQKTMARLGDWECIKVQDVNVRGRGLRLSLIIDGEELTQDERAEFAYQDGFRSGGREKAWALFCAFWLKEHGHRNGDVNFEGQIIHWKWTKAGQAPLPAQLAEAA